MVIKERRIERKSVLALVVLTEKRVTAKMLPLHLDVVCDLGRMSDRLFPHKTKGDQIMADISQIKEYSRQTNQRRPDGGPTYRQLPPHRPKPDPRSPDQVKDATIVLGVPKDEFTPRVHEAMTLVFDEMDSLRWELEVRTTQRDRLDMALDQHVTTELANRRALYRHLTRAAEHVRATGEPSFLLLVKLLGWEALWCEAGFEAAEDILQKVAVVLEAEVPASTPHGYLDGGSFGIVLNVATSDEVESLGFDLIEGLNIPTITCLWACAPIEAGAPATSIHAAAEEDARRRL